MENLDLKNKSQKSFIDALANNLNIRRVDSGFNRLLVSLFFCSLSALLFCFGFQLVKIGAKGEFAIFSEYKGIKLTLWSLSPGLFFILVGRVLLLWALPRTLKAFYDFNNNNKTNR